ERYNPALALAEMARDQYHADWILHFDVDEFLSSAGRDLRTTLAGARADDVAVLNVPCFNMIGPLPRSGQRATQVLTLRIDRPEPAPHSAEFVAGEMPVPLVFIALPPKIIVRGAAFAGYGPGMHSAFSSSGRQADGLGLHILHYPMRRFDKLQEKV